MVKANRPLTILAWCVCLAAAGRLAQADTMHLNNMPAGKILFLGNSITTCPQEGTTAWWGLTASTPDKDYAHLLTQKINTATGGSLAIVPPSPPQDRWYNGQPLPNWNGNTLNIADLFERNYNTWDNARIQKQLDLKADIVVLQFGENMTGGTLDQFTNAFSAVLAGIKNSSNPNIFVTSYIMGEPEGVAAIKRQLVAEDPAHRVYVDLTGVLANPANVGGYAHPSDAGMVVIADKVFDAMVMHSVPEPSSVVLLITASGAVVWYTRRRVPIVAACACLLATGLLGRADAAQLGDMQADKILFLGNSITVCEQANTKTMWGLSASTVGKDYAHLLAGRIDAKTGGRLTLLPTVMPLTNPDGSLAQAGSNVVNIADVFERGYASYTAAKMSKQLAWKADIVVLQFGENIPMATFNAEVFENRLKALVADLKKSGNPHIFMPSYILGANAGVDAIKRKLCAEDPSHRVFVDLSRVAADAANMGAYAHPNDKGMAMIADTLFQAMLDHSAAKSGSR